MASESASTRRHVTLEVLSSAELRESFVREARKRAPADVVAAMADVLAHHAGIVAAKLAAGQDISRAVSSMEDVVRRHHGSVAEPSDMGISAVSGCPTRKFRAAVRASARSKGLLAGSGPSQGRRVRTPPRLNSTDRAPAPRLKATLSALGLHRFRLPVHAVVCPERAAKRVAAEGRPVLPKDRALMCVHSGKLPTAVANPADHFFLPKLGRYVRPIELCSAFEVPAGMGRGVLSSGKWLSARQACKCLGGAIHPGVATAVARRLLQLSPAMRDLLSSEAGLRYASACSGVDMFAQGFGIAAGDGRWRYVMASERVAAVADALARIYTRRGLGRADIRRDACGQEACEDGAPADLWVVSADCSPYSSNNRFRSQERTNAALTEFDRILDYARRHRPLAIVVENVDMPDAVCGITACLASLGAYSLFRQSLCPSLMAGAEMVRRRMFWIALRAT